jgi:hypothetical protein
LLVIALLALPCPSIRAKLTRREHAQDRLLNMDASRRLVHRLEPAATRMELGGGEKDAEHERPKPQPEGGGISPSRLGVARSRHGEMLPS